MNGSPRPASGHVRQAMAWASSPWAVQYLWPCCLLLGLLVFGLWRCRYSLGLADEGFFLSVAWRFLAGDSPFADQARLSMNTAVFLWTGILAMAPDMGVLGARMVGVGLQWISITGLFFLYRHVAPPLLLALGCASIMFMGNGMFTPTYNWFGQFGFIAMLGFLVLASRTRRVAWRGACAFASIVFYALGSLGYPPLCLLAVPLLLLWMWKLARWVYRRPRQRDGLFLALHWWLGMAVLGLAVALLAVWHMGMLSSVRALVNNNISNGMYMLTNEELLLQLLEFIVLHSLGPLGLFACVLVPFLFFAPRGLGWLRWTCMVGCLGAAGFLGWQYVGGTWTLWHWVWEPTPWAFLIIPASVALLLVSGTASWWCKGNRRHRSPLAKNAYGELQLFWVLGIPYCFLATMVSTLGARNIRYPMAPLFLAAVVVCCIGLTEAWRTGKVRLSKARLYLTLGILLTCTATIHLREVTINVFNDAPLHTLTAEFDHPLLQGIHTTPERVEQVEALLAFLEPRLAHEQFFIVMDDFPMLYYLTGTRPALRVAWQPTAWPSDLQERARFLVRMESHNRTPAYAIMYNVEKLEDPVAQYLLTHYNAIAAFGPFEVMQRKGHGLAR